MSAKSIEEVTVAGLVLVHSDVVPITVEPSDPLELKKTLESSGYLVYPL